MLISSSDRILEAMKWKILHHFNPPKAGKNIKETFGFTTMKAAPRPPPDCIAAKPFKDFEDGLLDIIQSIEFRQTTNQFQKKLNEEIHKIRQDKNVFVAADKTSNFYKMEPSKYNELLENNITQEYKKTTDTQVEKVEHEDASIATVLEIDDRIHKTARGEAFIILKIKTTQKILRTTQSADIQIPPNRN